MRISIPDMRSPVPPVDVQSTIVALTHRPSSCAHCPSLSLLPTRKPEDPELTYLPSHSGEV